MKLFKNYPDIVSVEDIMNMLKMGKTSVYKLLRTNQIRHVRVGKKYVIPKKSIVEFISQKCYADTG